VSARALSAASCSTAASSRLEPRRSTAALSVAMRSPRTTTSRVSSSRLFNGPSRFADDGAGLCGAMPGRRTDGRIAGPQSVPQSTRYSSSCTLLSHSLPVMLFVGISGGSLGADIQETTMIIKVAVGLALRLCSALRRRQRANTGGKPFPRGQCAEGKCACAIARGAGGSEAPASRAEVVIAAVRCRIPAGGSTGRSSSVPVGVGRRRISRWRLAVRLVGCPRCVHLRVTRGGHPLQRVPSAPLRPSTVHL